MASSEAESPGQDRHPRASGSLLRISADLKNLAAVRRFIRDGAGSLERDEDAFQALTQAVDESLTNIVVHGYRGQPGFIEIELSRAGDSLVVCLRDQAPPFDPTAVPSPDVTVPLEKRPPGGLGVHLTRRLADRISYRPTPQGGNELTLEKRVFKPPRGKGSGSPT